jgi:regulator of sigma E protease
VGLIQNILAVIVVLGLLVTFHEFGHFWVARRCGVKVLRFSVGFGKPLWSRVDRHGTEFAIAAIPLGGYVKMLDEREAPVPEEQLDQAFNRKTVWQRIAIVAAGPIANFLLAIVAYWALFVAGTTVVSPMVGSVAPDSPAAEAGLANGDEIVAIQGDEMRSWEDVNLKLVSIIGFSGELDIDARPEGASDPQRFGLSEAGDRMVAINGEPVDDWMHFVNMVRSSPGETLQLTYERNGEQSNVDLTPVRNRLENGVEIGYIGAGAEQVEWPAAFQREIRYGPIEAVGQAVSRTGEMTLLTLDAIRKMFVGLISPSNLSGPITIAQISGDSARAGMEAFIGFLAYLSISLGVLNLLPIPVLDGGHLLYYFMEVVRGRPVSEKTQAVGLRIGLAMVGTLMLMALYFDLMRLW